MDIFAIIKLLGGLAMFLYGIEVMGDGLKNSSGAALKRVLEKVTGSVILGVLTGALVTAVIQSSTATIVLTVALIGAGVLDLRQAVSIVMGANIGTTITAQIIRLMDIDSGGNVFLEFCKPSTLAPLALVIGIILIMFIKTKRAKTAGDIFVGFGILFVGLLNMTASVEPLSQDPNFAAFLARFAEVPVLGILAGLVCTVVVQSSSAMVGMLQALSSTGAMTFNLIYPIIMGINLGTCITTAMVCSIGSSRDAKRTGVVHIAFNTIGTVIFMIVMTVLEHNAVFGTAFWTRTVDSGTIADFQTFFNLATAVLLLPFTRQLMNLSKLVVKDETPRQPGHPELHTLDEKLYISPSVALCEATKAIAAMGTVARENFQRGCEQLFRYDESKLALIDEEEHAIDEFADLSDHFLIGLSKTVEGEGDDRQLDMLMQSVPNFERIGDYATNLVELAQRMKNENTSFSESAIQELKITAAAVNEILTNTVEAFLSGDNEQAKLIEPFEEVIDDMVMILRDRHTKRLKSGACTISSGLVFMDTLTYLERASDQCSSIAVMMLARDNEAIVQNHYNYLNEVHAGNDRAYREEMKRRRAQYIAPLNEIV